MFNIDGILSFVLNTFFDIKDAVDNGNAKSLNSSLISLECIVTDDLPVDVRNEYCKALQVNYAMLIRSLININTYGRGNSTPKDIYRSIPLLTPYDSVVFNQKLGSFMSISDTIFNRKYTGDQALRVFAESVDMSVGEGDNLSSIGMEDSAITDAGLGTFSPTFIELEILINQIGNKPVPKKFTIAVQVKPRVVSVEEMIQFIVKQSIDVSSTGQSISFFTRLKNAFNFNHKRIKNTMKPTPSDERTLDQMMRSVAGIKKPFVCLLMSSMVRDRLRQGGLDVTKKNVADKIYNSLPVISIGIYDTNTDMITVSLLAGSQFETRTSGEFNSQISQYQRQLSELVRVSRYA